MITARPQSVSKTLGSIGPQYIICILIVTSLLNIVDGIGDSRCYLESGGSVENFFVSEDAPVGAVIGVLGIHGDPHPTLGNIALSLKEADSPVQIAPGSKNITLARPLDKEGVLGPSSVYVNVICDRKRTSDPGFVIPVSIRVTDANDNAPEWIGAPYRLRLAEVTAPGTRALQAARARDRDQQGPFSTVEYKVLPGAYADYFSFVNSLEGTLVLRKPLDYETLPNFTIALRAQDQGTPPKYSDTVLHVQVLDSDDQNPKFLDDRYTAVLPDRVSQGFHVMISPREISAVDQDTGINAPLFYSFTTDHPSFSINRDTATVTVARDILEDELLMPVTLVIRATQYDNPDRYALATLTVSKQSSALPAVRFSQRHYHATVLENLPLHSVLMTLHTNRPRDRSLKYFVSDRRFLTKFAINTAGEVVLRRALDYEEEDKYSFQVMVTDGQANDTATINITVLNVNDWEPRFRYPQYEFYVGQGSSEKDSENIQSTERSREENQRARQQQNQVPLHNHMRIGKVEAADGDKGDQVHLALSGADASLFYIDEQGDIYMKENALSLVNSSVVHMVAVATDSGVPPRQASVPIIVHFSEALMGSTRVAAVLQGSSLLLIIIFATVLALLAIVIFLLLGYIYKVKRPKSPIGNKVSAGVLVHEKMTPVGAGLAGSVGHLPQQNNTTNSNTNGGNLAAMTGALGAASGSLLSVSAGASTILANSTSSLNLHNVHDDGTLPRGIMARASHRYPGATVAPLSAPGAGHSPPRGPHPLGLRSAPGTRTGLAWPPSAAGGALQPAHKKLSWDDDDPKGLANGPDVTEGTANSTENNLTVYF